jgi:hypothetical protein
MIDDWYVLKGAVVKQKVPLFDSFRLDSSYMLEELHRLESHDLISLFDICFFLSDDSLIDQGNVLIFILFL